MEPKQSTIATLSKILESLKKGKDDAVGSYLYKGYHVQISRYKQSGSERVLQLYNRRRSQGLCIACGKKVQRKNPLTDKPYRLCDFHRKKIDKKK